MGINAVMKNALRTNWTKTDDFMFTFSNNKRPLQVEGSNMTIQDVLDMCVINIDLPQLGSDVESVMQAGEWRIYNTKFQPFTFSITFRDFGALSLRNYFSAVWMDAQRGYFDDTKSTIKISVGGKIAFESEECLITAVSQVQLDNSNSQIAEFTVEFSSPYYSNSEIKNFGSEAYFKSQGGGLSTSGVFGVLDSDSTGLESLQNIVGKVKNWF